ncbi:MAG: hypothetical protein GEU94_11330 [Micromonosporaceae bacterium]|nr:hypothetical protein [Micromonosporaceae bacterium]
MNVDPDAARTRVHHVADDLFDLAPFGAVRWWEEPEGIPRCRPVRPEGGPAVAMGDPPHVGIEWDEPRDVQLVVAEFGEEVPGGESVRVEYWRDHWPAADPESIPGMGRGWLGQDDPFHGTWTTPRGVCSRHGNALIFEFDPLDAVEFEGLADLERRPGYLARYRRTLKVRLVLPATSSLSGLRVYSAAREQTWRLNVRSLIRSAAWEPTVGVFNGHLSERRDLSEEPGRPALALTVRGTDASSASHDCTLVTFREPSPPAGTEALEFTVNLADLKHGPLWIRDLGVYVTTAEDDRPFEAYRAEVEAAPRQSVLERVGRAPEQTYQKATVEVPQLDAAGHVPHGRYVVLGPEAGQLKFGLRYNGNVLVGKGLGKLRNRLLSRLRWPGDELQLRVGAGDPPDFRERGRAGAQWLEGGWLPIVHTRWNDRDIAYAQVAFAALTEGADVNWRSRRGDEDPVLMTTLTATNVTTGPRRACVWLQVAPDEELSVDPAGNVVASGYIRAAQYSPAMAKLVRYDAPVLRATVCAASPAGDGGRLRAVPLAGSKTAAYPTAVLYEVMLQPGEQVRLDIRVPFCSHSAPEKWQEIARIDAQAAKSAVEQAWKAVISGKGAIRCPADERDLEDFIRAVPVHILTSACQDAASGAYVLPAAAFAYGACGNEAAWQIVAMDLMGHHDRARTYLTSLLQAQGTVMPDGDFSSAEGALLGVDFDQGRLEGGGFRYNLDHGTILAAVIGHYRLTGDSEWLTSVAANVVAACDFVTRERRATADDDPRTRGLLPPGHLEDNPEWRHWFAVNAHAHAGLAASAHALTEIGHPDAARLRAEAEAYRLDIQRAAREARVNAPVVRLLNGVAIPHVPARARLRGREFGWIREAGYGALHLWEGGVLPSDAPETTWILQDLEDNLFVSREFGHGTDLDRDWFSRGGVIPQPNLLGITKAYLDRDQVEHALRAFYNSLALALYRDVRCLAEMISEPGLGEGPFYKPSDEARMVTWLRHLLVTERGEELWLAPGAPRGWHRDGQRYGVDQLPTTFGHVSYQVSSHLATTRSIQVDLDPTLRRPPRRVALRLRHPADLPPVKISVNGQPARLDVQHDTVTLPITGSGRTHVALTAHYDE